MSWDIDLLVAGEQVARAAGLLELLGYSCLKPLHGRPEIVRWHRANKESVWRNGDGIHYVELHSRLTDNHLLIPSIGIGSSRQHVEILPSISLPTLATPELFAYLCVHGATSAWFRLKWAVDLAGLLKGKDALEVELLYRTAQDLGAARAAAQALLLVNTLFEVPISADLKREFAADKANGWLKSIAIRELASPSEPTERPLGTAMIHMSQLLLEPRLSYVLNEIGRQLRASISHR